MNRRVAGLVAVCCAVTALSGCGSGSSGDGAGAATPAAGAGSSEDCVAAATAGVAAAQKPFTAPTFPAIDVRPLAGKKVWVILADQSVPIPAAVGSAIEAAGAAADIAVTVYDGKSQPDLFNQGISSAVAQNADAIILYAINPSLVPGPLGEAADAGIPVVETYNGEVGKQPDGIYAVVNLDGTQIGKADADYLLATTRCTANVLALTSTLYPTLTVLSDSLTARIRELCPTDCKVQDAQVDYATLATSTGPLVSNALQRDPDINAVFMTTDGLATFVLPAVQALDQQPIIVGQGANTKNIDQIRAGSPWKADVISPTSDYNGWLIFDQTLRGMLQAPNIDHLVPAQLIDSTNLPASGDINDVAPNLANYHTTFTKAWGL